VLVTLERDANAFFRGSEDGIVDSSTAKHLKGCNCKKSECLKKYCECFQAGVPCSGMCKCLSCKNNKTNNGPQRNTAHLVTGARVRLRSNKHQRSTNPSIHRKSKRALPSSGNTLAPSSFVKTPTVVPQKRARNATTMTKMKTDQDMYTLTHSAPSLAAEKALLQALDKQTSSTGIDPGKLHRGTPVGLMPPGHHPLCSPQRGGVGTQGVVGTPGAKSTSGQLVAESSSPNVPVKDMQDVMHMNMPLILFSS